jgi:phosphohistidine phosphatase
MMLWVLRHGEAQSQASSDAARELNATGRAQVMRSATHLPAAGLTLLASPYLRTQQTAALVKSVVGPETAMQTVPWLTPDSDPAEVLEHLAGLPADATVLLVSHQPLVGALVGLLVHGHYREPQPMGTASLVQLEGQAPVPGGMRLQAVFHQ